MKEIGPRFELRRKFINFFVVYKFLLSAYCIKLGTLENIAAAEDEWILRSYTNTGHKKQYLSSKDDSDEEES